MANDNKPMQVDPALFETMSRLTASIPFSGHELGALTLSLETAIESGIHAERMDAERNAPTSPNPQ